MFEGKKGHRLWVFRSNGILDLGIGMPDAWAVAQVPEVIESRLKCA